MVNWDIFSGQDAAWDELTRGLDGASVFQGSSWARHKKSLGWEAIRAVGRKNGAPAAAAQFLVKRTLLGAKLLWARGGPSGEPSHLNGELRALLSHTAGGTMSYGRFCSYRSAEPAAEDALAKQGWRRPKTPLNKPFTFMLDLGSTGADVQKGLSENWAHNLRRGQKRCRILRWDGAGAAELVGVYRSMEAYKGLAAQQSEAELSSLLKHLGQGLVLYKAEAEDGTPAAFRACAVRGAGAWDLLAASSAVGRKTYASYALLWALLEDCRGRGVQSYDLGGADREAAKGVFDFKKGTGASPHHFLGEWDWASPGWLRAPAGRVIAARGSGGL